MGRGVKKQEGEDFSPATLEKVIAGLAQDKPITKKAACEMLHITYNTTRLGKIISEYTETRERDKMMRKKMRSKPIDIPTASLIVSSYLSGTSLADISDETYRSTAVIKNVLKKYNVPIRNSAVDYFHPVFLEDDAVSNDYMLGDLVYSARYDMPGTIDVLKNSDIHGKVYGIWFHGDRRFHAYQPYYELADLRKVQKELSIKMKDMEGGAERGEIGVILQGALKDQKKQLDKRK